MNAKSNGKTFFEIYLSPKTGEITDNGGKKYTLDEAKQRAETTPYRCNVAFAKLVRNDFDLSATMKEFE